MNKILKILITGSNGYIGSSLSDYLEDNGYEVIRLNRSACNLLYKKEVDIYFSNMKCDVLIHTAVVGGSRLNQEDESVISDNMEMFCNLLRHRKKYEKFIHFGSGAQCSSNTFYGLSKKALDTIIDKLDLFYNINIYGLFNAAENDTRFIKANIKRALSGEDIIIHKNKKMDFFHMKDLLKLVEYYIVNDVLEKKVDCSYKTSLTLLEIAGIIKQRCNPATDIKIVDRGYEEYCGTNTSYLNQIIDSDFLPRLEETIDNMKLNV